MIQPWGIPVSSRRGVGRGRGRLRWQREGEEDRLRFEFGAASIPERAHGLRQIGYFEEALLERDGKLLSSEYVGFFTAAPPAGPRREALEVQVADQSRPQHCCAVRRPQRRKLFLALYPPPPAPPPDTQSIHYQYGDRQLRLDSRRRRSGRQLFVEATVTGQSRHCFRFELADSGRLELPTRIEYQPKAWLKLALVSLAEPQENT